MGSKDRQAADKVVILDQSPRGKCAIMAEREGKGWYISLQFPARGVDPIIVPVARDVQEDVSTVRLLEAWIAYNWQLYADATRRAQKMRYAYREKRMAERRGEQPSRTATKPSDRKKRPDKS